MPSGRSTVLGIVSVAAHAAVLVVLANLPSPTRVRTIDPGELIEVVQWSGGGAQTAAPARRDDTRAIPQPAATTPPPPDPPAREPDPPPDTTSRPRPPARPPAIPRAPAPAIDPAAPSIGTAPTPPVAGEKPSPHALALHGLRERSTARAQLPSPRASPGIALDRSREHTVPAAPDDAPSRAPVDDGLPRTLADAGFSRNRKGEHVYKEPAGHFTATVAPDGRVHFKDHLVTASKQDGFAPRMAGLPEIIRKAQRRELWAHDKAKLARRTFDLRLAIAVAFAESQIDRRLKSLYRDLLEIWSAPERPAANRRITLFERWDECDESMRVKLPGFEDATDTRIDALRKSAGERARDTITAFVRRQLPKGSTDAYSEPELERLNRHRRSKARFAPYDAPESPPSP